MWRLLEFRVGWAVLVFGPPAVFLYLMYLVGQLGHLWPFLIVVRWIWYVVDKAELPLPDPPSPVGPRVASPSPHSAVTVGGSALGAVDSSGLILYWALKETVDEPHPSLVLADPNGKQCGGFDIHDPVMVFPIETGCRALVHTRAGEMYVVDGIKGTSIKLALSGKHYSTSVGGGRWGFFHPEHPEGGHPRPHALSALVDFETGAVTDLDDIYTAHFSPDGETLAVTTWPDRRGDDRIWLIPVKDPGRARAVAVGGRQKELFGFDGQRLLYLELGENKKQLVVEDLALGTKSVAARVATTESNNWPNLGGWFISGRPEIAIRYPRGFAVVDASGWIPREIFYLKGRFDAIVPPSSCKGAVLVPIVEADDVDPVPVFVDLEELSARRLENDKGEPGRIMACANDARWVALLLGEDESLRSSYAILHTATGEMSPLPALEAASDDKWTVQISADGRKVIVDVISDIGARRCTFLDLDQGTVTEFDVPSSDEIKISVDGSRAAYSVARPTYGAIHWDLNIVELATGKATLVGPGSSPVWLVP